MSVSAPPAIGVSTSYLDALVRLPSSIQKKANEFLKKLRSDPTSGGIHIEKLQGAVDEKVRSARVDQAYRAILVRWPRGDGFQVVWVAHHDDAYDWVQNRRFEVNPKTGTLQVFDTVAAEQVASAPPAPRQSTPGHHVPAFFDGFDDASLLAVGLPELLLPAVRGVLDEEQFEVLRAHLPVDASEGLTYLAAGYTIDEALEELTRPKVPEEPKVDVEDFRAALERPQSKREFALIEDDAELEAILSAPLEKWRLFLHPSQLKLVQMRSNGPVRVLGGAGTGKTVVLLHRARHLVRERFTEAGDRLLVTTFTRNLASDLERSLTQLCGRDSKRIEVATLHSWAARHLARRGKPRRAASGPELDEAWREAFTLDELELPLSFYRDEWERIVQAQEIRTRNEYLAASRIGRGTRLGRLQRARAWKVLDAFRRELSGRDRITWDDLLSLARKDLETNGRPADYRAVLSDEVQDFTPAGLRLLRAIAPDAPDCLFLVGDGHQRIYGSTGRLGACGIEIRGRSRRLTINYRTTEQIQKLAMRVLDGVEIDDLDDGKDTFRGYTSLRHGPAPLVVLYATEQEEAEAIKSTLRDWLQKVEPRAICLATYTNSALRGRYARILEDAGISIHVIETEATEDADPRAVRLATMHRMKGLEFERVLLADVQQDVLPPRHELDRASDEAARAEMQLSARCLLYVAMSRARDVLHVMGHGTPSTLMRPLDSEMKLAE